MNNDVVKFGLGILVICAFCPSFVGFVVGAGAIFLATYCVFKIIGG